MEAEIIKQSMEENRWQVEQPSKSKTAGAHGWGWTVGVPNEELSLTFNITVLSRDRNCMKVLDAS
jgi:hypothetical protein